METRRLREPGEGLAAPCSNKRINDLRSLTNAHSPAASLHSANPVSTRSTDRAAELQGLPERAGLLGQTLPDLVSEAVDCPDEPRIGPPERGDIEIRFRQKSQLDVGELNIVIEVRTKLFEHRAQDKQWRADLIRDRLSQTQNGLARHRSRVPAAPGQQPLPGRLFRPAGRRLLRHRRIACLLPCVGTAHRLCHLSCGRPGLDGPLNDLVAGSPRLGGVVKAAVAKLMTPDRSS
jgi:hypothetical protein